MSESSSIDNTFLLKITEVVKENISNEQFGVSELADEMAMSRSNLLRKVQKISEISVSQLIREIRLREAMEMLKQNADNVSEVSFKVGFGSASYFIKCFRDYYGYPPGEVGKEESKLNITDDSLRSHQLAAIMFTDIEGYTALMQRDEVKAIEFRDRHREVFEAVTKKFRGRILQYYGDGTLSTFSSAIDAVRCGIEMQVAFYRESQIPVRIGIHTGDIIVTKEDIIGDGVNVASRIESLATVGSVFISEKVYDEVKNQPAIQTISMGTFELKNVAKPMEVFAITNPGLAVPEGSHLAGKIKSDSPRGNETLKAKGRKFGTTSIFIILLAIILGYFLYSTDFFGLVPKPTTPVDTIISKKSIAVLPFINDSNDSANVYIINGLMESTLNNLQKIQDLRVISRTSVEKYRNNPKAMSEIARELNVKYIVEGSGQKIGDQILLNIQLIDAQSDQHLWSEQFNREAKDIFELQIEVAKNITDKIQVIITPEVEESIEKIPTQDLVAYDYFLKGLDILNDPRQINLDQAIPYFEKAIEHDDEFARAYAAIAITYYMMDTYRTENSFSDEINYFADKALLFDPELPQSLIAKGLFYMYNEEYLLAESYFEKSLEFSPSYDVAFVFLVDLYVNYLPNTEKYLEYALKGLEIDITAYDSATTSLSYLHISNAFIQSGFVEEAEKYINKSLLYQPENLYSAYVKAYILYAKNQDLGQTKELVVEALDKDPTRLDILQELGKIYYYLNEYDSAFLYYKKFLDIKEALNLDIYRGEGTKIAYVWSRKGLDKEAEEFLEEYKVFAENDQSIYKHLSLSSYYASIGNIEKGIDELQLFSEEDNYHYWIVLFLEIDPLMNVFKKHPEFQKTMDQIETKFEEYHNRIRTTLEEKGLI